MPTEVRVRDAGGVAELVEALASQVRRMLGDGTEAAIVGVRRGGVALAARLVARLAREGGRCELGTVDIALYRDDTHLAWPRPETGTTDLPFAIEQRDVVIVDDVFWTGRTARAAMDAVLDYGRPRRLWLATLAERPGRELPILPDATAIALTPAAGERVVLRLVEDGHASDELVLVSRSAS
jgi:pyrimidine operon attenuation protein/uracil phosphoribosyltransferase